MLVLQQASVLAPTPWVVMSAVGSMLVGGAAAALSIRYRSGGGVRTVLRSIGERSGCVYAILVADATGGIVFGAFVLLVGYSRVSDVVPWVNDNQLFGWCLIGSMGPVVSDRIFRGTMFEGVFSGWMLDDAAKVDEESLRASAIASGSTSVPGGQQESRRLWSVRREAVYQLSSRNWVLVQSSLIPQAKDLRRLASRFVKRRDPSLMELPRVFRSYSEQLSYGRRRRIPQIVIDKLRVVEESVIPTSESEYFDCLDDLMEVMIRYQIWEPLEVVFHHKTLNQE